MSRIRIAIIGAALLSVGACTSSQRSIYSVEQSAEEAYGTGQYQLAAREYAEVVQRRPGKTSTRIKLAETYLALGEPAKAREHLEIAYTIWPRDERVINNLVRAMVDSGDAPAATKLLQNHADRYGTVTDYIRLGKAYTVAGDYDRAERSLVMAAQLDRGQSDAPQVALAEMYQQAGDPDRALERWRMALYANPYNQKASEAIRSAGHIPGPTFAIPPTELRADAG